MYFQHHYSFQQSSERPSLQCFLSQLVSLMGVGPSRSTFDSITMIDTYSLHWLQRPPRLDTSLQSTPDSLGNPEGRLSFIHLQASCTLLFDMISSTCWAVWSGRLMLGRMLLASYSRQVVLREVRSVWQVPMELLLRHELLTLRVWVRWFFYGWQREREREQQL